MQVGFNDFVNKCEQMEFEDPALMAQGKMSSRDLNKMRHLAGGDKWASRPISELETSQWEVSCPTGCCSQSLLAILHDGTMMACCGPTSELEMSWPEACCW